MVLFALCFALALCQKESCLLNASLDLFSLLACHRQGFVVDDFLLPMPFLLNLPTGIEQNEKPEIPQNTQATLEIDHRGERFHLVERERNSILQEIRVSLKLEENEDAMEGGRCKIEIRNTATQGDLEHGSSTTGKQIGAGGGLGSLRSSCKKRLDLQQARRSTHIIATELRALIHQYGKGPVPAREGRNPAKLMECNSENAENEACEKIVQKQGASFTRFKDTESHLLQLNGCWIYDDYERSLGLHLLSGLERGLEERVLTTSLRQIGKILDPHTDEQIGVSKTRAPIEVPDEFQRLKLTQMRFLSQEIEGARRRRLTMEISERKEIRRMELLRQRGKQREGKLRKREEERQKRLETLRLQKDSTDAQMQERSVEVDRRVEDRGLRRCAIQSNKLESIRSRKKRRESAARARLEAAKKEDQERMQTLQNDLTIKLMLHEERKKHVQLHRETQREMAQFRSLRTSTGVRDLSEKQALIEEVGHYRLAQKHLVEESHQQEHLDRVRESSVERMALAERNRRKVLERKENSLEHVTKERQSCLDSLITRGGNARIQNAHFVQMRKLTAQREQHRKKLIEQNRRRIQVIQAHKIAVREEKIRHDGEYLVRFERTKHEIECSRQIERRQMFLLRESTLESISGLKNDQNYAYVMSK